MYYLNAFNEMLRKRQQNNMMGGGQDQGVGTTAPSGPLGARQSGNGSMAGFRNALTNMNPFLSAGLSMIPGVRAPLALARLGAYAYDKSQASEKSAYADDSMDRLSFNAPAYGQAGPDFGPYPNSSVDPSAYEGAMSENSFNAFNMGGGFGAPNFTYAGDSSDRLAEVTSTPSIVGGPISSVPTGESLAPMAGGNNNTGVFDARTSGESATVDTGNPFGGDAYGGSYQFAKGGMVDARHLKGKAPAPDDGYGALQGGEYVITKAAVEKYGKRLLDAINNGTFR
jgi:hypothetical protein